MLGTLFYMMDFISGKIYKDPSLPELDPESRKKVYSALNQTIAKIHSVDVTAAGTADYGKHGKEILINACCEHLVLKVAMLQGRLRHGAGSTRQARLRK